MSGRGLPYTGCRVSFGDQAHPRRTVGRTWRKNQQDCVLISLRERRDREELMVKSRPRVLTDCHETLSLPRARLMLRFQNLHCYLSVPVTLQLSVPSSCDFHYYGVWGWSVSLRLVR